MKLIIIGCCLYNAGIRAQQRPHIVMYLADDAGFLDNSVYGDGQVRTPTMEKLAREGMRFDNAFVASPACAPSRAALLTGLMPARNGAEANHTYPKPGVKALIENLKAAGYTVVGFGKIAHEKMNETVGFDVYSPPRTNLAQHVAQYFKTHPVKGPVCLLVGDRRPHVLWTKNPVYDPEKIRLPPYFIDTRQTRLERARYYSDVTGMDEEMGKVFQLADNNLGANTVYVYTSDHGAQWPFGKWNLYDLGIRTPLLISWKGHIKPGVRTQAMVSWVDIFPTFIDLAGSEVPAGLDGKSFTKILSGKANHFRDKIYTTHSGDGEMNVYPIRSVRDERFHYILNLHPEYLHTNHSDLLKKDRAGSYWNSWYNQAKTNSKAMAIVQKYHRRPAQELYDVKSDPMEQHNLAADPKYRELVKKMDVDLRSWMRSQGDKETVFDRPILEIKELSQ
ncbi:sulfatase [Niabella insulamsoli]|uniref:sulfatase family protein n=1 Tax=Niabella insulamsoli TaxID=3144874 RepID=UPI0031FCDD43